MHNTFPGLSHFFSKNVINNIEKKYLGSCFGGCDRDILPLNHFVYQIFLTPVNNYGGMLRCVTPQICCFKVLMKSIFLCIYLHSIENWGFSVHLFELRCYEINLFCT